SRRRGRRAPRGRPVSPRRRSSSLCVASGTPLSGALTVAMPSPALTQAKVKTRQSFAGTSRGCPRSGAREAQSSRCDPESPPLPPPFDGARDSPEAPSLSRSGDELRLGVVVGASGAAGATGVVGATGDVGVGDVELCWV